MNGGWKSGVEKTDRPDDVPRVGARRAGAGDRGCGVRCPAHRHEGARARDLETEPDFVSWQAALQREGVPFEAIVTSPGHQRRSPQRPSRTPLRAAPPRPSTRPSSCRSAPFRNAPNRAASQPSRPSEWTALEEYEHTFNVRQVTGDIYPGAGYGLNSPASSGALDGIQGALSTDGKTVFPYLKGPVGHGHRDLRL